VDVSGAHGVAVEHVEDDTGGAIRGEGVGGRHEAVEVVIAVFIAAEFAAEVVVGLVVWVLEVVFFV